MVSLVIKAYLCLGMCLLAIVLSAVVYTYTATDLTEVEISAVEVSKSNKVKIDNAALHTTLVEGDVMFDLHGGTFGAAILGCVLLVATISLSAVKFRSWRQNPAAGASAQHPQP
jgi:GMP synthase-like glutamine amidotransferase